MNRQQLIEDNMNLVYFIINAYYPTFTNDEDVIQSGMMGLCHAADTFDERKSKFSTYASRCICNEINMEFRSRKKHRNQLSLDYEVVGEDGERGKFGDYCVGEEDVEYFDFDGFYNQLNPTEKEIFNLRQKGVSVPQIAEKLGCGTDLVHQKIRRIKSLWRVTNGN